MIKETLLLIRVSRPAGWILAPLVFLATLVYTNVPFSPLPLIQMFLLSFPLSIIVYGINDVYDYKSDRINPRKKNIEGIRLKKGSFPLVKKASLVSAVLLMASSIATLNISNIISMSVFLTLAYFYSAPPLRLKERPPLDSMTNGLYFIGPVALAFSFHAQIWSIPLKAWFATFCVMGVHSLSTMMDFSVDKKIGHKTFSVVFGKRPAALFALLIFTSTLIFSGISSLSILSYLSFCALLSFGLLIFPDERFARVSIYLIFLGFIVTCILFFIRVI